MIKKINYSRTKPIRVCAFCPISLKSSIIVSKMQESLSYGNAKLILDSETQIAIAGMVIGMVLGISTLKFFSSRDEADEKRLENIRTLNRATKEATGEYMSAHAQQKKIFM